MNNTMMLIGMSLNDSIVNIENFWMMKGEFS